MQSNGKVKKYFDLSSKYLNDADECMRKGDYVQASEKLWGATVTIVKAIAAQRKKTIKHFVTRMCNRFILPKN